MTCEDLRDLNRLRDLLKATVKGLMENSSVQATTLMMYVLSLMGDGEKQMEKEKEEKKVRDNEAGVWVTESSSKRTTSDGRAQLMVEEEVKLSGMNRNEKDRKKVNKTGKEEIMGFGLQLLNAGIDKKLFLQTSDESHQLLDLTVDHILFVIRMCRSLGVIQQTLRLVDTLLNWRLEAIKENVIPMKGMRVGSTSPVELLFTLLSDFSATSTDLSRSIFHTLSVLLRDYPQTPLTTEQARALLMLVHRDLGEVSRQASAFELIRVILSRKLVFSELYDLMDELAVMMLQAFSDSTRNQCNRALLAFTLNYPMSDARVEKLITFVLKNVDYDQPSGRLADLHFIQSLIKNLPIEVGMIGGDDS